MLVLSRKRGEKVRIGDSVEVTILAISGTRVKLGFSGPPDVFIHRDEIHGRLKAEEEATMADDGADEATPSASDAKRVE